MNDICQTIEVQKHFNKEREKEGLVGVLVFAPTLLNSVALNLAIIAILKLGK